MFRKDLAELKSNRKWSSSHTLDVGLLIETKKAFASNITYPKLKKLPPLNRTNGSAELNSLNNQYSKVSSNHDIKKDGMTSLNSKDLKKRRKEDLTAKLSSLSDLVKEKTFDFICISSSSETYKIPKVMAFTSSTIKHIYEATQHRPIFKESNGSLTFAVSDLIMKEVLCFLYTEWVIVNLGWPSNYEPIEENILQILEFGLYLGLQRLVEMCCKHAGHYIQYIDSLDGLPEPVIFKILSGIELTVLIQWEFKTSDPDNIDLVRSSYVYHFNQNPSLFLKYLKNLHFNSTAHYEVACREACIQWFFDSNLLQLEMNNSSFKNLLGIYGHNITQLTVQIDNARNVPTKHYQNNIAAALGNLKNLQIKFVDFDSRSLNLIESLQTISIEKLSVTFENQHFSDDIQSKILSRILKSLAIKRSSKFKRNAYLINSNTKMDVSGVNHFTSDEASVSDLMAETVSDAIMEVDLKFHALNEDIVNHFEQFNTTFIPQNIKSLCFSGLDLDYKGMVLLVHELPNFKNLTSLNISGAFSSDEAICYLMKNIPPLIVLDISKNILNSSSLESLEASKLIAKYIQRPDSCLKDLNISMNRFSFMGIRNILESLENYHTITSIDISDMEIKSCLTYLSNSSNCKIQSLNLANNAIIPRSLKDFLSFTSSVGIRYLDLSRNYFDRTVLDILADQISDFKLPNLSILKLAGSQEVTKLEDIAFEKLIQSFINQPCRDLKEIDLSNHLINDFLCKLIAEVLMQNKKLQLINLSKNRITIEGVKFFSPVGAKKSRIIQIDFTENYIHGYLQSFDSSKKWRHYFNFSDQIQG